MYPQSIALMWASFKLKTMDLILSFAHGFTHERIKKR
jgi:hypothetical protein